MAYRLASDTWKICTLPSITGAYGTSGYLKSFQIDLLAPLHPNISRGQWLRGTPYSQYIIEVEPFGKIDVPGSEITSATRVTESGVSYVKFTFYTFFDISMGDCRLAISTKGSIDKCFYSASTKVAVDVPVHQTVQDAMGYRQAIRNLNSANLNGATGFVDDIFSLDIGSAFGRAQKTIMESEKYIDDATMANRVSVSGQGTLGSYMSYSRTLCSPKIHCYFQPLSTENNADKGRPLNKNRQISNIPGFIQCSGAVVESGLTQAENTEIINLLNSGFFYE